jgi:hypothetical protein
MRAFDRVGTVAGDTVFGIEEAAWRAQATRPTTCASRI